MMDKTTPRLYVGTMNDGVFIIDVPPAPVPVDEINPNRPEPNICIPLGTATKETCAFANRFVRAANRDHLFDEMVEALESLLDNVIELLSPMDQNPGDALSDVPVVKNTRAILARVREMSG